MKYFILHHDELANIRDEVIRIGFDFTMDTPKECMKTIVV
jgi:hypothetical protein